jgi:adhesin transport system outer membrane protein
VRDTEPGYTLEQAVKDSLVWHPQVNASANSRYSANRIFAAKGGYLPSLDLTAGSGWEQTDNSTTRAAGEHLRNLNRSESAINLTQNVFNGFATTSRSRVRKQR